MHDRHKVCWQAVTLLSQGLEYMSAQYALLCQLMFGGETEEAVIMEGGRKWSMAAGAMFRTDRIVMNEY